MAVQQCSADEVQVCQRFNAEQHRRQQLMYSKRQFSHVTLFAIYCVLKYRPKCFFVIPNIKLGQFP